jgi:putative transposase
LGRKHLKVSRQRKDFAVKTTPGAVKSNDFVAYEDLQVRNMVKNHKLAKSISDAAWNQFAQWLQYFGKIYGKTVIAVAPEYTSQDCSACGNTVKKLLSTRTHICCCGAVLDRDHNAARNILAKGLKQAGISLNTVGHTEINAWGQSDLYSLVAASTSKSTD